jgi:hypothetical protein
MSYQLRCLRWVLRWNPNTGFGNIGFGFIKVLEKFLEGARQVWL